MLASDRKYRLLYERSHLVEKVGQYLLSIITAAIICGLVNSLLEKNKTMASISKLLTGLVLLLTILRPMININVTNIFAFSKSMYSQSQEMIENAKSTSTKQERDLIKSRTEQYIIESAKAFGANISVSVELDSSEYNIPRAVAISGMVSPFVKTQLTHKIEEDLGIPREAQTWTG